jgi:hypothetical protein
MTPSTATTDEVIALLDRERAAFLAQAARMPAARQAQRPTPDRWSVVEIMEHVARIDTGVGKLLALRAAEPVLASPQQLAEAELTPERIRQLRDRTNRIEAPERVRPTGTLSPDAVLAQLATARSALKSAFLAADRALLDGVVHPHPILGLLTLRGWVTLTAHHDARHAQQIAEVVEGSAA